MGTFLVKGNSIGRCGSREGRSGEEVGVGAREDPDGVRSESTKRPGHAGRLQFEEVVLCSLYQHFSNFILLKVIEVPQKFLFLWFIGIDTCCTGN